MFRKILFFFHLIINSKFIWRKPKKSDILIFDINGYEYFAKYLESYNKHILFSRSEVINIQIFLKIIFKKGLKSNNYFDLYINIISPKLIITFTDNNPYFYKIKNTYPEIKTLFIQNGWRGYYADIFEKLEKDKNNNYYVDYMLVFGETIANHYKKYIIGKSINLGSLKNNLVPIIKTNKIYSITYVSQWSKGGLEMNGKFYDNYAFFTQFDKPILHFLLKYTEEKKMNLAILPRYNHNSNEFIHEKKYFKSLMQGNTNFIYIKDRLSSYKVGDQSNIVVGIDSTILYEFLGRGIKTAFFSIRSQGLNLPGLTFGWPKDYEKIGDFWTNEFNIETFTIILDNLFLMDKEKWENILLKNNINELMFYDYDNSTLKKILIKELT